jgi:DNA-binding XRE family transcriptional regulator
MNEKTLKEAGKLIASFLKNRREHLDLTQEDLAILCGVKRQTIQKIEYGKFLPNMELFLKITHHLKCFYFLIEMESNDELAVMMRERWGKISEN